MSTDSVQQIIQLGRRCWQRGWTRAGSCAYSFLSATDPNRLVITTSRQCRSQLTDADIQSVELGQCPSINCDINIHAWIAKRHYLSAKSLAIVQTQSIWSNLLADRFATLDGVLLEDHQLLDLISQDMATVGQQRQRRLAHWLPIVPRCEDRQAQIAELEKALQFQPTDCQARQAFIIQGHGLWTWASDFERAFQQAEIFEYFCEYLIRRALMN